MPKRKPLKPGPERFGERLAKLRKAAGYSQRELAKELGISQRMIVYYEKQTEHPPTSLMPALVKVLNTTADELLGIKPVKKKSARPSSRLLRKLKQIESIPPAERRQITQLIDVFLERAKLKQTGT